MSLCIAIKDKDKVYLACDSQSTSGPYKETMTNPLDYKFFKMPGVRNTLMAHTGAVKHHRLAEKLELKFSTDDLNLEVLRDELVPYMEQTFDEAGYLEHTDNSIHLQSRFLVATKDKIFSLDNELLLFEHEDYAAIGSCDTEAKTYLAISEGEDIIKRILKCFVGPMQKDRFIGYPILITDTKTLEVKSYSKEEVKRIVGFI